MFENESWKAVEGWTGYGVSDFGRVRSFRFHGGRVVGGGQRVGIGETPRIVKQALIGPTGGLQYLAVSLSPGRKCDRKMFRVHLLVLSNFVGPCPPGMQGCHNNGDQLDNRLSNLRWDTPKNNSADKVLHGTTVKGSDHHWAKLADEDIQTIFRLASEGMGIQLLSRRFHVSPAAIGKILRGHTWKHVELPDGEFRGVCRIPVGSKHPCAKLTEQDIPVIRLLASSGIRAPTIARRFGVSVRPIRAILDGETWRHVP